MTERTNKFAFILTQKQDPDSKIYFSGKFENRATYRAFLRPRRGGVLFAVGMLFSLFFPPPAANAGILSFFSDLISSKEFLVAPANSQTMELLEAARNSDPNPNSDNGGGIIVNDSAILANSAPGQSGSDKPSGATPPSDQISVYVVRKGDTLSAIAKMFGVSANTILWANDISRGGGVSVGQKLVILPVSGVQYTVKKGDTVVKISALYKADAEEIYRANDIEESEKLTIGDSIIIPNGVESEAQVAAPKKGNKSYVSSGSSFIASDGYFVRPTAGRKTQGIHGHNGIDFHAGKGTAVVAAAAGMVVVSRDSGWGGGYGQYIVIKHSNGTQTLYAHLSDNAVSEGQEVSQGQRIGSSGDTGKSFGAHLHFEVRGGRNPF